MDPHDSDLYSPSIGLGWLAMFVIFIIGFAAATEPVTTPATKSLLAPAGASRP